MTPSVSASAGCFSADRNLGSVTEREKNGSKKKKKSAGAKGERGTAAGAAIAAAPAAGKQEGAKSKTSKTSSKGKKQQRPEEEESLLENKKGGTEPETFQVEAILDRRSKSTWRSSLSSFPTPSAPSSQRSRGPRLY